MPPIPVIIDTDPGIDDALALLLAARSPELKIEAVTVVAGNTDVHSAARNALLTLDQAGLERPPPVALGCTRPLERDLLSADHVHGPDGIGGASERFPAPACGPLDARATDIILAAVSDRPGQITLIALGPLTNIATAILQDSATMRLAREIIVMGGSLNGRGNVTPAAEYNFYVDPEAARIVINSGIDVLLVGLDVTRQAVLPRDEFERRARASGAPHARFALDCSAQYFDFAETHRTSGGAYLHDPLAVAIAVNRSLVTARRLPADIETQGKLTTGMLVADLREGRSEPGNINVCLDLDSARFLDLFLSRVAS